MQAENFSVLFVPFLRFIICVFRGLGIKRRFSALPNYFTPEKLEFKKDANLLKGGLVYADAITTVSNTYAKEIQTSFYGEGLEGLLQARDHDLRGIVNGIDYEAWNPKRDPYLSHPYDKVSVHKEKVKNKIELQESLGLSVDADTMLISMVTRLTDQKGLDLVERVFDELCQDRLQFVTSLGSIRIAFPRKSIILRKSVTRFTRQVMPF